MTNVLQEAKTFAACQIASCVFGLHLVPQIIIGLHSQTTTKKSFSAHGKPIIVPDVHFRLTHAHDEDHGTNVLQLGVLFFFFSSMFSMYLFSSQLAEHTNPALFLFRGCASICVGIFLFYVAAVLFGAPMVELVPQTVMWATIQSIFSLGPIAAARAFDLNLWKRLYALNDARSAFEMSASWAGMCSIVGVWLGACLIPLDWDEPWQKWPITLIHGGSLGFVVGHVVAYMKLSSLQKNRETGYATFLKPLKIN
jgi:hypothetical protein